MFFADEGISVGKDTSTLGSILRNSSVTDQGKKAKAVMHYLLIIVLPSSNILWYVRPV